MPKIRAIRLSKEQEKLIEEFLKANPFFDFSTLARTALMAFIENPTLKIKSIKPQNSENLYEKR